MAITERTVQNKRNSVGELTGKPGIVYDVNIKHKVNGQQKTHSKKGFATKKEALQYEAAMKNKLSNPSYVAPTAAQRKMTVEEYLEEWVERHGNANLRPSTKASYRSHIRNHVIPYIGSVPLGQVTPAMLDDMFRQLYEKGLSHSSVKYAHRVVGVAFEHARKYHYIENNPARDVITKFGKQGKTPDPYTTEQMSTLFANVAGSKWELIVVLGGLYGLRLSEILGLRWRNIDLESKTFAVVEQLPFGIQAEQRTLLTGAGQACYDNDLVIAKPNGAPERRERVSSNFGQLLRHTGMPHMRFHDLRHSAATNMHQLTGDFYTVGMILGHSLKGIGIQLGISNNLESVTAQYVDVRLDRKQVVLDTYHRAVLSGTNV